MALLMYLALALAVFSAVTAKSKCPAVACTLELYPGQVQKPAVMVYKNEICEVCGKWLSPDTPKDKNTGCPLVPCPYISLRPGCARSTYFIWKGKMCQACDQEFC